MAVAYRGIGLGLAVNPAKLAGKNRDYEFNLNSYYAFNYRKFSFPAAFSQSYIQKRSAGSWMVGASFDGSKTVVSTDEEGQVETATTRTNMKYHFPSAIVTGRGAAIYSWRNKFAGATAVYNFSVAGDEEHLQLMRNKWRLRMFFGFRF